MHLLLSTLRFTQALETLAAAMDKDLSSDIGQVPYDEKNSSGAMKPEVDQDEGGRRGSVALNIVENPLKVNFAHLPLPY